MVLRVTPKASRTRCRNWQGRSAHRRLPADSREIIAVIVLQDFSFDEAVVRFGWSRRMLFYALPRALDETSEILLRYGLMPPFPGHEIAQITPATRIPEKLVNPP